MKTLFIINDAPYGSERMFNSLRLATVMQKDYNNEISIFMLSDAVSAGLPNQGGISGLYKVEDMLKTIIENGGKVKLCITCSDMRGINESNIIKGIEIGNLKQLSEWVMESDKVLTF